MIRRGWRRTLSVVVVVLGLTGCGPDTNAPLVDVIDDDAVTIASFDFPESEVLAELYAQALEARGITVERQLNAGPRELLMPALESGLIELIPEYTGSALDFLGGEPSADPEHTAARLADALESRGLRLLRPAPAQDRNAFAVTAVTAHQLHVDTLSSLRPFANGLVFGGPHECLERRFCIPGLERRYGLEFERFVALDAGGPVSLEALTQGFVDVVLLFTSDPAVHAPDIVVLRDDRELQPTENVVPIVHAEVAAWFGVETIAALDRVSDALTTEDLRDLNEAVGGGTSPADAARAWLLAERLVEAGAPTPGGPGA